MKNKVLKGIGYTVGVLWAVSACAIDSESMLPTIVCLICSLYLIVFSYANNWWEDYVETDYGKKNCKRKRRNAPTNCRTAHARNKRVG